MTNVMKISFIIVLCLLFGIAFTFIAEEYNLLPTKQDDVSSLINTIWQVHAGVATTSIAILALITGLTKEKKYGYKTLDFMLNINRSKFNFKFHEEVIISLILLFFQYIFVASNALAGSVFLFFIAGFFILRIFYCSIKLTLFEDNVNREIRDYIKINCSTSIKEENKHLKELEKTEDG